MLMVSENWAAVKMAFESAAFPSHFIQTKHRYRKKPTKPEKPENAHCSQIPYYTPVPPARNLFFFLFPSFFFSSLMPYVQLEVILERINLI